MYGHCSWCCPSPGIGLNPELILALLYYSYLLSSSGCNQISLVPWGWHRPFYHKLWLSFGGEDKKVESRWSFLSFLQCLLSLSPIYVTQGRIYQDSPNLVCDHQVGSLKKKHERWCGLSVFVTIASCPIIQCLDIISSRKCLSLSRFWDTWLS